jgi:hypothetical protein
MNEVDIRRVKEIILSRGDDFWNDGECTAVRCDRVNPTDWTDWDSAECPLNNTVECPCSNVHLLDDILQYLHWEGYDLALVPYTKLDAILDGKA